MYSRIILLILTNLILSQISIQAQNLIENNKRSGRWIEKDEQGFIFSEGYYRNGLRVGNWKYYLSPISRFTGVADITGSFDSDGMKTGKWTFISSNTKIRVDATFVNNKLEGPISYHAPNGDIMADGNMKKNIREGNWIFYNKDHKMCEGNFEGGLKVGQWDYDYYPENNLHVTGSLNFENGQKNGRLEFYEIDRHPRFGTEELLSGVGSYFNGQKYGRWIEYHHEENGPVLETGNYNRNGNKEGYWVSTINGKNHKAATYKDGTLHGIYKEYHKNGVIKYKTNFSNGLAVGDFIRYYDNGNYLEKGSTVFSSMEKEITLDTLYYHLELPYEYHFFIIDLNDYQHLDHHYIDWITDPEYAVDPNIFEKNLSIYNKYGHEAHKRISEIKVIGRKTVRDGNYLAYHKNGKLSMKGQYLPLDIEAFDHENKLLHQNFARHGTWEQFDEQGRLEKKMLYDKGELIKILESEQLNSN